ncbi:hypothetical protein P0R31_34535 [Bradyrhizobium yuanmingense]|uniref:hypothetical protein n=1 Tax=Bradyrhizobium yuanmingense TaxID=108015 RepID=UPI0023B9E01F|nr:hypothetical protein [Bradyrhizobium yuanmingense]MDF0522357.1 hypothetical protein [Bradyrhizobium yuanmingense]
MKAIKTGRWRDPFSAMRDDECASCREQAIDGGTDLMALMPPHLSDTALLMPAAIALPQTLSTREITRMIGPS